MKNKRKYNSKFGLGVVFVAMGSVFLTSVNRAVGLGLLVLGIVFMVQGRRESRVE